MDHHDRYHTILLTPYMFWTTYACAQIAPHKNVLRPCLHDEVFARLDIYKPIFRDARGVIFNTEPEAELARSLFELPRQAEVVGEGIDVPTDVDPERFRRKHGLDGDFVLYAGRREWGKNVDVLAEYFARYIHRTPARRSEARPHRARRGAHPERDPPPRPRSRVRLGSGEARRARGRDGRRVSRRSGSRSRA